MPTVALIQINVLSGDPEANLARVVPMLAEAADKGADLAVLPEMWTTGFCWDRLSDLAAQQGPVLDRLVEQAREHRLWINGSIALPVEGHDRPANTSVLIAPTGEVVAQYRKVHLFTLFQEQRHVTPGRERITRDTPCGKAGLAVCYDLRFPELFRAYALDGVILQLLPSAWPHPRLEHWRTLIRARAIENQMFVIAVNQIGSEGFRDGTQATYCGHSAVIDPWGHTLVEADEAEGVYLAQVDPEQATRLREKMTVLGDRRPQAYR